jgi:Spy/CpxP family protein refolding chaperone
MRTRVVTRFGCIAGVVFSLAAAGAEPVDDDQPTAELKEHHRHHQHGGISQFVELGLDTLGEDEAERPKVEKLHAELHACTEPIEEKEASALLVLAEGVASGAVDPSKVEAAIAQLAPAGASIHDCVAGRLNQLHAALSPVERLALADKVQAHWAVWRAVNVDAVPGGKEPGGRLSELAKELSLKPEQVAKASVSLQASVPGSSAQLDAQKVEALVQRFATAFSGATFDATSVTTNTTASLSVYGTRQTAQFYQTVAPLLTPEQRATLASHLREHAQHHPTAPEGGSR